MRRHKVSDYPRIIEEILKHRSFDKALYVYDTKLLSERLDHLKGVFPANTSHAVAIKSNSYDKVLEHIVQQGCGLEAASFEEVLKAVNAGCSFEKIVFDSPVKTIEEIENCNRDFPGMILNANCFQELDRLQSMSNLKVGIRINPLIDPESPGIFNVSGSNSKFGIPISEKKRIMEYALTMDNVCGLHIHAGSEIGNRANHITAISSIVEIAEEIKGRGKKLDFIDIGGGISASESNLNLFFDGLISSAPKLLDYQIITEYGRFVQSHCAFVASRVEYVLDHCSPEIALIHVGADLFPREIYSSSPPKHDYYVLDSNGQLKEGSTKEYDIGGPLCFSGDFVTKNQPLPEIQSGDIVVITDAGANSLSMWSRHCSREEVEVIMI